MEGTGGEFEEGVLRRQSRATRLSESTQKTVTLLKLTFKLEAISAIYYVSVMESKMFDIQLIPEFFDAATDMPIVVWIENVELVCELCTMKNVERVLPLRLQGGVLAIYRQLSAEQKADAELIKQVLITAYATDAFNAYDQFVTRQLCPDKTVDEFFC